MTVVAFRYAARSDIGLGRRNNQDSGYAGTNLLVVADGMGGHAGGDVASSLAISELAALDSDAPGADALQELERAVHAAAATIRDRVGEEPSLASMGTTVTAILRHGNRLALAHIGDSRAYLLRGGELTQVTTDHTFVQKLVDDGRISAEEAGQHPQRNIVLKVIGDVAAPEDVDTSVRETQPGDRWLLCSDGLSGPVSRSTLAETLAEVRDPDRCADELIQLALRAGGNDNITCIVADVVRETESSTTAPQVVGAAATDRATPTRAAGDSAAAKAAALTRPTPTDEDDYTDDDAPPRRLWLPVVAALGVLAVLGAGLYGAWAWSQQQYFVGTADGKVAIYSGLSSDIGPIEMSNVYSRAENLPFDTLNSATQTKVAAGIGADDLPDAKRIVSNLYRESSVCEPTTLVVPVTPPAGTPNTSTDPNTSTGAPTAPPEAGAPATPAPVPSTTTTTLPVPAECGS